MPVVEYGTKNECSKNRKNSDQVSDHSSHHDHDEEHGQRAKGQLPVTFAHLPFGPFHEQGTHNPHCTHSKRDDFENHHTKFERVQTGSGDGGYQSEQYPT